MSKRHYRVIILGDSLAARLSGALLAKGGARVLSCNGGASRENGWFHSSALLEKILEDLAGRSIYSAPVPFQVVTGESRLDLQGDSPLEEELRREFPASHLRAAAALRRLAATGESLEALLWEKAVLPLFGFGSRLSFTWHVLRRGLGGSLRQPLTSLFSDVHGDQARPVLNGLFAGLALVPAERLSVAEGALLWSASTRPRTVSRSGLDTLLRQRFAQFHGEEADLGGVVEVRLPRGGAASIRLRDGGECSADHLLLGSTEAISLLPEAARRQVRPSSPPTVFTTEFPEGVISPMIAPRVILPEAPALRLRLTTREDRVHCEVEVGRNGGPPPDAAVVRRRLSFLFPFADVDPVLQQEGSTPPPLQGKTAFPGASGSLRLGHGLLLCHGATAFPTLGSTGEIITGFSVARHLLHRTR